jgi:hypothetical protein
MVTSNFIQNIVSVGGARVVGGSIPLIDWLLLLLQAESLAAHNKEKQRRPN